MPWKTFPENGKHCNHKLNPDGSKGELVACHDNPESAAAQIRALYAHEGEMMVAEAYAVTRSEGDGNHPAGHYLVIEDPEKPSTWHLRVKGSDGKPDHRLMGAAWAALHGGYRGNKYEGPGKQEAIRKLRRMYAGEEMEPPGEMMAAESTYLLDEFVTVRAGEPYRLFPFGKIIKGGKVRNITPEMAARFRLPHFKPAIKLGSHKEDAPAGGHIIGLEVRADGLYAIPEFNQGGQQAVSEGHYRYQSPEAIFEDDRGFEDPVTGELIAGPLIVGDALLHMPHLGEAAALYSVEPLEGRGSPTSANFTEERIMSENTVNVPESMWAPFQKAWAAFAATFGKQEPATPELPPPQREPVSPAPAPEQFTALVAELEATRKQVEEFRAEAEQARQAKEESERITALTATLASVEQYGATFQGESGGTAARHLDSMTPEAREWTLQTFRSLHAVAKQGATALQTEIGNPGNPETTNYKNAAEEMNALIMAKVKEGAGKVDYAAAFEMVRRERPDLAGKV